MLAYVPRRRTAERRSAPHAMLAIIAFHVAAIAAVMSAKMDLPERVGKTITETYNVPLPPPPPEPQREPRAQPKASPSILERVPAIIPTPIPDMPPLDLRPIPQPPAGEIVGPRIEPQPKFDPAPLAAPVRTGPRFATPASAVRPPYPASKISSDEEAVLKLRLSIDERGRVVAVDPVGPADPAFLQAARKHLLAKWRYTPATEAGRPVASSTVITLRFELEG